jgi:orotidine-5'-phosphate decarboxylase
MAFAHLKTRTVRWMLGIDPKESPGVTFTQALENHRNALESPELQSQVQWIKPNLSFFLSQGSAGILALEGFLENLQGRYKILLDAKFSEIENSLKASLSFCFHKLRCDGVTLNPFLGEKSIALALDMALAAKGEQARVFVLCRTSETPGHELAHFQSHWQATAKAVVSLAQKANESAWRKEPFAGVVVGAGAQDVLTSPDIISSGLSVLAPGLGAQGASAEIVKHFLNPVSQSPREIFFPMSRGVFAAGAHSPQKSIEHFHSFVESCHDQGP